MEFNQMAMQATDDHHITISSASSTTIGTNKRRNQQRRATLKLRSAGTGFARYDILRVRLQIKSLKNSASYNKLLNKNIMEKFKACHKQKKLFKNFILLNSCAQKFYLNKLKLLTKQSYRQRYSLEEVLIALVFLKHSPKAYCFFSKLFRMPSKSCLSTISRNVDIHPGINSSIFSCIRNRVKTLPKNRRFCILIWDHIKMSPHAQYKQRYKQSHIKKTALVFMLRSITDTWKQPLAFYFVDLADSTHLKYIIKTLIKEILKTGLNIVSTVCSESAANQTIIESLIVDTKLELLQTKNIEHDKNSFIIHNTEIFPIFDPPSLLKEIRNSFINSNIRFSFKGKNLIASWEYVKLAYEKDATRDIWFRQFPKLTQKHLNPQGEDKEKVYLAAEVFSQKLASGLFNFEENENKPSQAATGVFLSIFDQLFDTCNSNNMENLPYNPLRNVVSYKSDHVQFWQDAVATLKTMHFLNNCNSLVIKNWIFSINNFINIIHFLKTQKINKVQTRFINKDPLENFFSAIRGMHGENNIPTPTSFVYAFNTATLVKIPSKYFIVKNCKNDLCSLFTNFPLIYNKKSEKQLAD